MKEETISELAKRISEKTPACIVLADDTAELKGTMRELATILVSNALVNPNFYELLDKTVITVKKVKEKIAAQEPENQNVE